MWEKIEQAMMKKGIKPTTKEFRRLTGFSTNLCAKFRANRKENIRVSNIELVANILDVSISELLGESK
ncbi:MAG TPA: helix-turn-helix transcriptional regulator [Desulfosporosinus sp.]|uniref:Putative DNA binding, helix-turn-helix domain containing protein n=1 Tax=viral metagenome TaxID=1070528 RepID=A0A6M3JSP3_9ZZZZ|nr:helix-turn-helix transcriptional regulator [Desulfosporosinus sp.]